MNKERYLLLQLASECMELGHSITKALQFGTEDCAPDKEVGITNLKQITQEAVDVRSCIEMLQEQNVLPVSLFDKDDLHSKKVKVAKWAQHSSNNGILEKKGANALKYQYPRVGKE